MGRSLEQFILQARRASLSCFRGLPPRDRQFIEIRGACHEYILEAIPLVIKHGLPENPAFLGDFFQL